MLVLVAATVVLLYILIQPTSPSSKDYSYFQQDVLAGNVTKIVRDDTTLTVTTRGNDTYTVESDAPSEGEYNALQQLLISSGKTDRSLWPSYSVKHPADTGWIAILITTMLPIFVIVLFIVFFMR